MFGLEVIEGLNSQASRRSQEGLKEATGTPRTSHSSPTPVKIAPVVTKGVLQEDVSKEVCSCTDCQCC